MISLDETIASTVNTSNSSLQLVVIVNASNNISYNQPKLDPLTVWNPNGITFADNNTIGLSPYGIFINQHNTIYVPNRYTTSIKIWSNESVNSTTIISAGSSGYHAIFVASNNDMYIASKTHPSPQITRWNSNTNNSDVAVYMSSYSFGLFIDINNTLYFSIRDQHHVLSRSLASSSNTLTVVAGTSCSGSSMNMLNQPHGITVDTNFDLYVADAGNNRIQLFRLGSRNGITVAGSGSTNVTITLKYPLSVILDADKYLFIADRDNHRIIGSGPFGFRCIIGCSSLAGSTSDKLNSPPTIAFDSYGNIYATDENNNRIQKFLRLNNTDVVLSYNQPKLCPNATWNENATTFANSNITGTSAYAFFINTENIVYVVNYNNGQIHVWLNNSVSPDITLFTNFSNSRSMFVTANGDIYVGNDGPNSQVSKLTLNSNTSVSVMSVPGRCLGLFVDMSNTLYCSLDQIHQVMKKWLGDNSTISTIVAGNGSNGSTSNMLCYPNGIFVDTNFDLYVADYGNNRIQLFRLGQSNAITINITLQLKGPTGVVMDSNKYLYIADRNNYRVISSGPFESRCIVGCSGSSGSTANTLSRARNIAFDSYGNLFVADENNGRLQKFQLLTGLCDNYSQQNNSTNVYLLDETTTEYPVTSTSIVTIQDNVCDLLYPCQNQGICYVTFANMSDYNCICIYGFNGTRCQYDRRICTPTKCWNHGKRKLLLLILINLFYRRSMQ